MQKHVNLVDLVKSFPTNIFLQNLASIQKRTSPKKFAHLAEKSGNGSISNLSTKGRAPEQEGAGRRAQGVRRGVLVPRLHGYLLRHRWIGNNRSRIRTARVLRLFPDQPGGSVRGERANFTRLVLGARCGYRMNHQKLMGPEVLFRT